MMKLLSIMVLLSASVLNAATADEIVAVVGQRVITRSELEQQIFLYAAQYEIEDRTQLAAELLNQMIEGAVLLEEAKKETVSVLHRDVEEELSAAMERMKSGFATEEEFQRRLEAEHLTVEKLKNIYREGIREQILIRKLVDEKIRPHIRVSPLEVQKFYEEHGDSIQTDPEKVRMAHILLPIVPSAATLKRAEKQVEDALRRLREGLSFSAVARTYSDDPSRERGGDLGYFQRGELAPNLEEECFALEPGQLTTLSSEMGYHIILCEEKSADSIRISQILVATAPTQEDSAAVRTAAEELKRRATGGEDFSELARAYSQDEKTRENGGDLGYVPIAALSPPFSDVARSLEPGEISQVVLSRIGYHLIKLEERVEPRAPAFSEIKEELTNYLVQRKLEEEYGKWVQELKEEVFIDIRL